MAARITVVGGGSTHWTPRVLSDCANTESLHDATVVLHDIDASSLPAMCRVAEHIATTRGIDLNGHRYDRYRRSAGRSPIRSERILGRRIREHGPRHRDTGPLRSASASR